MAFEHEGEFGHLDVKGHVCKDCLNFKDFREKCWYFWEEKKDCSQKLPLK